MEELFLKKKLSKTEIKILPHFEKNGNHLKDGIIE